MKAGRAQIRIIKQQESIISLLIMLAGAAGLEPYDVQEALGTDTPIAPNKKPSLSAAEVADLQATEKAEKAEAKVGEEAEKPAETPEEDTTGENESADGGSEIPNELPIVSNE